VLHFAAHNVEDERVTRDLLVRLDLDNVARLDAPPVRDLEALVALGEDELLHWLAIDLLSGLLELFVVEEVEAASGNDGGHRNENHVRVVCRLALPRDRLRAEVNQQDHVIELEDCLVQENSQAPEAGVVIEDEGVLVLVEVVEGALRDSILDFNGALDVLLVCQLHLSIDALLVVPLGGR